MERALMAVRVSMLCFVVCSWRAGFYTCCQIVFFALVWLFAARVSIQVYTSHVALHDCSCRVLSVHKRGAGGADRHRIMDDTQPMTMMKPNSSKSNDANALPPKERVAPDAPPAAPAPSSAMATRMLAEVEEAEAAVRAAKIAARRAALGERVLELAAERVAAVASKSHADALRLRAQCGGCSPLPPRPRRWWRARRRG
jgi:hypothetical protein